MTKDKVSVIIPVYNGAAWIEECIESVLAQTWQDFEVIVPDDHSVDGTAEIVQRMAQKDARIRLILRNGKGVSGARNEGIAQSCGEYITFLDADDKLEPKMMETLIRYLKEENSDMVFGGYYRWTGKEAEEENTEKENTEKENAEKEYGIKTVDTGHYLSDYLLHHYTHCWGGIYKRDILEHTFFRENLCIGEDMMFLMDLLPKLSKVTIADYKGYYYRVNQRGVTLKPFVPAYMDEVKSWQLAAEMISQSYPRCIARAEGIKAVSAMLVAGKIAQLSRRDRKQYQSFVKECRRVVAEALKVQGAKETLPSGYGIKTKLFMGCPGIYLNLYHLWKK